MRFALLIEKVVPLGTAISVEVVSMIDKVLDGSLKNDNVFLLGLLICVDEYVYSAKFKALNRKRLSATLLVMLCGLLMRGLLVVSLTFTLLVLLLLIVRLLVCKLLLERL